MPGNLLILGAGIYGEVAREIAISMHCFNRIGFLDDHNASTPLGTAVIGTTDQLKELRREYDCVVVAIGNPTVRMMLLERIQRETDYQVVTLISPRACVSESAKIGMGCIVEPMATIHTGCVLEDGCLISAGSVINHAAVCGKGVHVDCNSTVAGYVTVPDFVKIPCGTVFDGN